MITDRDMPFYGWHDCRSSGEKHGPGFADYHRQRQSARYLAPGAGRPVQSFAFLHKPYNSGRLLKSIADALEGLKTSESSQSNKAALSIHRQYCVRSKPVVPPPETVVIHQRKLFLMEWCPG